MITAALILSGLVAAAAPSQIDWKHPYNNSVPLNDGGICVGLAWVRLQPGEVATVDYGPDFNVYRVRGSGNAEWGSYSGFAGQSTPDVAHALLTKDGVTVYRGTDRDGSFNGYFVGEEGRQNHFFGKIFEDSPSDTGFFDRVIFGSAERARCEDGKE
jgi:hypothetical protein